MNFKIKYLKVEKYEILALEKYLENMALKGWHLAYLNANILRFKKGEKTKVKYSVKILEKLSYLDDADSIEALDLRKYYEEAGWEFVTAQYKTNIFVTRDILAKPPSNKSFKEELAYDIKKSQNSIAMKLLFYIAITVSIIKSISSVSLVYDFKLISLYISILPITILAILYSIFDLIDFLRFKRNFKEFIKTDNYIEFFTNLKNIKWKINFLTLLIFLFVLLIITGLFDGFPLWLSLIITLAYIFIVLVILEVKYRFVARSENSKKYIWILIIFHIVFVGLILNHNNMDNKRPNKTNIEANLTLKDFNKKDGKKYYYEKNKNTPLSNLIGYWEGNNDDCLSYDFIEVKYDFLVESYYKDVIERFRKNHSSDDETIIYSYEEIKGIPNGLRGVIIDSLSTKTLVFNMGNKIMVFYLHENIPQDELIKVIYEKLK